MEKLLIGSLINLLRRYLSIAAPHIDDPYLCAVRRTTYWGYMNLTRCMRGGVIGQAKGRRWERSMDEARADKDHRHDVKLGV